MKRLYIFILVFATIFLGACSAENTKTQEESKDKQTVVTVTDIVIDEEFYSQEIFIGDDIDLSLYDITIYLSDSTTRTFKLGDVYRLKLDTSSAGTKDMVITYLGQTFIRQYEVKEIYITAATVKQNNIIVYFGEEEDLEIVPFNILLSNGVEENHTLTEADVILEDPDGFDKQYTATVTYSGFEFNFSYTLKLREIEENHEYELIDKEHIFEDGVKIEIAILETEIKATFFKDDCGNFTTEYECGLVDAGNGRYEMTYVSGGFKTFVIYAYKDKVVIEEKQA